MPSLSAAPFAATRLPFRHATLLYATVLAAYAVIFFTQLTLHTCRAAGRCAASITISCRYHFRHEDAGVPDATMPHYDTLAMPLFRYAARAPCAAALATQRARLIILLRYAAQPRLRYGRDADYATTPLIAR